MLDKWVLKQMYLLLIYASSAVLTFCIWAIIEDLIHDNPEQKLTCLCNPRVQPALPYDTITILPSSIEKFVSQNDVIFVKSNAISKKQLSLKSASSQTADLNCDVIISNVVCFDKKVLFNALPLYPIKT